jgi:hypothetical protein
MRELERELRSIPVGWPPTPDLAASVRAAIAERPPPRRHRMTVRRLAVAALVLLGGAFALPPARAAILDVLGLRSVRIERREPRTTPGPRPTGRVGAGLQLGTPVTLAQARTRARELRPSPPAALGPPAGVFFARYPPEGGRVSFVYGAGRSRLLVTVMRAQVTPFIEKSAGEGTRIVHLRVGGEPAVYLAGRPHGFAYVGRDKQFTFEDQRLAGPTLLVERSDGVLVRVEGDVPRARAIAVAASVP